MGACCYLRPSPTPSLSVRYLRNTANRLLAAALGAEFKGKISIVGYLVAIPVAFVRPRIAYLLYILVAIMWLIPDKRIEREMSSE